MLYIYSNAYLKKIFLFEVDKIPRYKSTIETQQSLAAYRREVPQI